MSDTMARPSRGRLAVTFRAMTMAALSLALVHVGPARAEPDQGPLGRDDAFHLLFEEEFDAPTLRKDRWTTCYWWDKRGCTNLSSHELQWYLPGNVAVEDGNLVLTARPDRVTGVKGRTFDYSSGIVTTGRYASDEGSRARLETTFGFFEIRAWIPSGQGLWPAFWMLPSSHESLPEIDIMEVLGHRTDRLEMHFHYRDADGEKKSVGRDVATTDLSSGWHVYGLDWSPDRLIWYLDGVEMWRYSESANIPTEPMYLVINLAVGGRWPGNPDETTDFPATLRVDYVRVWKRP